MRTIIERSRHNRSRTVRLVRHRWRTLLGVFLGASLALPFATNAQIVGTAQPRGSATLAASDNTTYTSKAGNPLDFDSTIHFQGLTAHGQASNDYIFEPQIVGVGAHGTLSVSGALIPGYDNAYASLVVGASLTGQSLGPAPPDGVNYMYDILGVNINVRGVLAPGDSASFHVDGADLRSNGSPDTDLLTGLLTQGFFAKTFTNTGTDMMAFSASETIPAGFLGDWYYVRETQNFPTTIEGSIQAYITKTKISSSAESWIEVDPTWSLAATVTGVPEPSSLVLASLGLLCMGAYAARQRLR